MIGGGSGIFGVFATEGSGDWVILLVVVFDLPGESVDEGTDGVDTDAGLVRDVASWLGVIRWDIRIAWQRF